jgi:hypothetical protein
VYEIFIKHSKDELLQQLKESEARINVTKQLVQALSTDKKAPEILDRLRRGETYESIVEWLGITVPTTGGGIEDAFTSKVSIFST